MQPLEAEAFPYKLLSKYPGMRPKDEVIWDKFVHHHPGVFNLCWYNVPVGNPAQNDIQMEEMQRNGAWGVSTWRIDVVAIDDTRQYVIEVKPHADTHAIGEVLAYRALLIAEGKIREDAVPMIVTDDASMILLQACTALGVVCQQV